MRKSPLILVADDEPLIAQTLVEILEAEGFETMAVSDGAAAVLWAREGRPDIVVCDVIMPTLNGIEAAKQIRQFLPGAQIVLFSGQAAATVLVEQAAAEGYRFEILAKPIKPDLLLEAITKFLKRSASAAASKLS
jgi:CheY-like chemotaxis protein